MDNTGDGGTAGGTCPGMVCDDGGGHCTLRAAIQCYNSLAFPPPNTIDFNISGCGGVCTITIGSPLGALQLGTAGDLTIDGTTQSGSSCGDLWGGSTPTWNIVIDAAGGANFGLVTNAGVVGSGHFTLKGVEIKNITGSGDDASALDLVSTTATVTCCYFHDANTGISLNGTGTGTIIGGTNAGDGNVIAANAGSGIGVTDEQSSVLIAGNFVGVLADGTTASANDNGIALSQGHSIAVGNVMATSHNLLAGNIHEDVRIDPTMINAVIESNYIGINKNGNDLDCHGLTDHGAGTQILNNRFCAATPTATATSTPADTPTQFPTPLCCSYSGGVSCVDTGIYGSFFGSQLTTAACQTVIPSAVPGATFVASHNGEACVPEDFSTGACVTVTPPPSTPTPNSNVAYNRQTGSWQVHGPMSAGQCLVSTDANHAAFEACP